MIGLTRGLEWATRATRRGADDPDTRRKGIQEAAAGVLVPGTVVPPPRYPSQSSTAFKGQGESATYAHGPVRAREARTPKGLCDFPTLRGYFFLHR